MNQKRAEIAELVGADDDEFAAAEISEEVKTLLDALTPEYRQVLTSYYLEEKGIAEIAHLLQSTPLAVKSLLYRARSRARTEAMRLQK